MNPRVTRKPPRFAPEGNDYICGCGRPSIAWAQERQQKVDGDWSTGEPARGSKLRADRRAYPCNRPKTARLGHSRGQLVPRNASHPRLNDWRFEVAQIN
jgi:hypothetical protein